MALKTEHLQTINAIHVTPFKGSRREIDWEGLEANIRFLLDNGLKVIVTGGNTGEFYSLTLEEVKAVTRKVAAWARDRAVVIAGIGYAGETAVELGRVAQEAGCAGVMIHQPIHPYAKDRGLIAYYEGIMEALDIPSILYVKDPQMSDSVILGLTHLEQLIGVKYAVNDLPRFAALIRSVPKEHGIAWICGTAEKWAPFFHFAGAVGFTSGLVNVHPAQSFALLQAMRSGHDADVWAIWRELLPFENLRAMYNNGNNVIVVKEAMELLGFRAGETRPPVDPLDETDRTELAGILNKWQLLRS